MTAKKLKKILESHNKWVRGEKDGKKADLHGANLSGVYLDSADLSYADLRGADLSGADLCRANLSSADLHGADLRDANLRYADLRDANFKTADLSDADLHDACLHCACLIGAKNVPFVPMVPPESGSFIGWKKAEGKIVKLLIPEDARRSSATSRKCRCDKAKVLAIENLNGNKSKIKKIASAYDKNFVYEVGKTVKVPDFCKNRWQECAPGIHFFVSRREAVEY